MFFAGKVGEKKNLGNPTISKSQKGRQFEVFQNENLMRKSKRSILCISFTNKETQRNYVTNVTNLYFKTSE